MVVFYLLFERQICFQFLGYYIYEVRVGKDLEMEGRRKRNVYMRFFTPLDFLCPFLWLKQCDFVCWCDFGWFGRGVLFSHLFSFLEIFVVVIVTAFKVLVASEIGCWDIYNGLIISDCDLLEMRTGNQLGMPPSKGRP